MAGVLAVLFCCQTLEAQFIWDGGGANANLGTANNWNPNTAPGRTAGADLQFAGSVNTSPILNNGTWTIHSLTFNSGAASFTVGTTGGNSMTLGASGVNSVINNSSNLQTINAPITLAGGAQTWSANSGDLAFGGTINNGGFGLTLNGGHNFTLSGVLSGSGALTVNDSGGTLTLSGTNTYSGVTNITGGTLKIAGGANTTWLGSNATVNISNGGTLDLGGVTANVVNFGNKQFNISGTGAGGNGAIVNSGTVIQTTNAIQNVVLTGDATIGGGDGSNNTQNGRWDIRGGTSSLTLGNYTLTKTGSNQVSVVAGTISSTVGGGIVVNQGEFAIQTGTNASGPGTFTFNDGTTLGLWKNNGSVTMAMTFNGSNTVLNESSTILAPSVIGSNMTINGTTNFDIADTTALTLTGQLTAGTGTGTKTIILNGANSTIYKTGTPYVYDGQLNLGSNQTFNGTLDLNAGTLDLAGFNLTVNTLHITGDSTIDFGAGVASILSTTNFIIDPGVTLTIADWVNTVDYFYAQNFSGAAYNIRGVAPENQVAFTGFSNNSTLWQSYDSQITPVPESAIYGALLTAAALGLFLWHRRKTRATDPALCRDSHAPLTRDPCKSLSRAC